MRTLLLSCLGLIFVVSAAPAASQARQVSIGDVVRLRLSGAGSTTEGTLTSITPEAWTLSSEDGGILMVDPTDVVALERRTVRRNTGRGALIGAGAGLVVGLIATSGDNCDSSTGFEEDLCRGIDEVVETSVLLTMPLLGAGLGALIGALAKSHAWAAGYAPAVTPTGSSLAIGWRLAVP